MTCSYNLKFARGNQEAPDPIVCADMGSGGGYRKGYPKDHPYNDVYYHVFILDTDYSLLYQQWQDHASRLETNLPSGWCAYHVAADHLNKATIELRDSTNRLLYTTHGEPLQHVVTSHFGEEASFGSQWYLERGQAVVVYQ